MATFREVMAMRDWAEGEAQRQNEYNYGVWNQIGRNAGDLEKRYDSELAQIAGAGFRENQRLGGTMADSLVAARQWVDSWLDAIAPEQRQAQRQNDYDWGMINSLGGYVDNATWVGGSRTTEAIHLQAQIIEQSRKAGASDADIRAGLESSKKQFEEYGVGDGLRDLSKTPLGKLYLVGAAGMFGGAIASGFAEGGAFASTSVGTGTAVAAGAGGASLLGGGAIAAGVSAAKDVLGKKDKPTEVYGPPLPPMAPSAVQFTGESSPQAFVPQGGSMTPILAIGAGLVALLILKNRKVI